jgi:hypothetical protein
VFLCSLILAFATAVSGAVPQALTGTVRDASGGVLPGTTVELSRDGTAGPVVATAVTGADGTFSLTSVPPGRYRLRVALSGFDASEMPVTVGGAPVPALDIVLTLSRFDERVTVHATASVLDLAPTARTPVTRDLIDRLPSESVSSGLSSLVTLTSPGVAADSNGVFHPLGEHAETSFVIDGQPISDQQSRIFSNQLSPNAIQSIEITTGVPAAEYGDKTSLVATVVTRSGLAEHRTSGSATLSAGSFRSAIASIVLGRGTDRIGNFVSLDGTTSRRFLDTPEVEPLHAGGGVVNLFDRFDVQPSPLTHLQANVTAAWSAFETPNTYDQEVAGQDQRQRQWTFGVAPSMSHVFGRGPALDVNAWVRHDRVAYEGSADTFSDQPAALGQRRTLTNAGARASLSWIAGRHTLKAGVQQSTTWLDERFHTGVTDPAFNSPCFTLAGEPSRDTTLRDPQACAAAAAVANPDFLPGLLPFDLTRGGSFFTFDGTARIVQWAGYVQDAVALGALTATAGARIDRYDGLSHGTGVQPRAGVTYRVDRTGTVLRAAYGRMFPTPYNENLVLASSTGAGGFRDGVLGSVGGAPLTPARRNEYDLGGEQRLRGGITVAADWFWKITDGAYDFDVILNTPLTFPTQFRQSRIGGGLVRIELPRVRGVSAYATLSHTGARLFGPELGGLRFSAGYAPVARPDHDEPLQSTTHIEYRTARAAGFWAGLTWRYDSGLVAVSVPTYADALRLTGDQQAEMGLFCGGTFASVTAPIRSCAGGTLGATRLRIPAAGTGNDDTNPPRVAPHHLVDVAVGLDRLVLRGVPLRARVTIVNALDSDALYNFLSTFSGTHFVAPRSVQAEIGVRF